MSSNRLTPIENRCAPGEVQQQTYPLTGSVSVIVPCRNEVDHIKQFLDCVLNQETGSLNLEILIADGMSDDGTRAILLQYKEDYPALRLIDNRLKTTPAGLNQAIRSARGQIIVRMDVHTSYAPDYILRCVETLWSTGAANVGGPALTSAEGNIAQAIAIAYHIPFVCGGAKFHDPDYEGYVDTVTYGCWLNSTFQQVGLFDEHFTRNQDDELNFRIIRSGGRIWQSRHIRSWYKPRKNLTALAKQYFQYGLWKTAVIRKHGRPASYRHLIPAACISTTLALWAIAAVGLLFGRRLLTGTSLALWVTCASIYLAASVLIAINHRHEGHWRVIALLPVVSAVYHLSYGSGFVVGLFWRPAGVTSVFSTVSKREAVL